MHKRYTRHLLLALTLGALAGCAKPYRHPEILGDDKSFPGIRSLAAGGQVRVLMVHGMCDHDAVWIDGEYNALRKLLGGTSGTAPGIVDTFGGVELWHGAIGASNTSYQTYAVLWAPVTREPKKALCYDVSHEDNKICGVENHDTRAKLNSQLKSRLMNECLADAVIYAGPEGGRMLRAGVKEAVLRALAGARADGATVLDVNWSRLAQQNSPLVIITSSLGSKILFDSIYELDRDASTESQRQNLRAALAQTRLMFMYANQIPILDLAHQAGARLTAGTDTLKQFMSLLPPARGVRDWATTVVAFNDPNDLLSYKIVQKYEGYRFVNVLVSNDNTFFSFVENPLNAHTTYGENDAVKKLVVCGAVNGAAAC